MVFPLHTTTMGEAFQSPKLYKDNGFLQKEDAGVFIAGLTGNTEFTENENGQSSQQTEGTQAVVEKIEKKKEQKKPPQWIH